MGSSLVDADWYAFCQALYKGIKGEDWEELYNSNKVMRRAVGVKKPQEAQKAEALWAMKAAKDRNEEFYDPAREEDISRRNTTLLELWEEHLKESKAAKTSDWVVSDLMLPLWERSCGLFWMLGTLCVCAQPPRNGMSQGDTGRTAGSSSSF